MPKVSVIIPVYNVEKYLRECLNSAVNQTLKDIEIICVNDCSHDNSLSILNEYAKNDNRIKIIDLKENGGLGNARNIALPVVTSDYVMFLDSDDWLELNACEAAYNQILQNNNDFVIFGVNKYKEAEKIRYKDTKKLDLFFEIYGVKNANPTMFSVPYFLYAQCCFKIFNMKFIKDNNLCFDRGKFEDQIFNTKIYTKSENFSVLQEYLYNYRVRRGSISQSKDSWKDCINVRKKCFEYIGSLDIKNKTKVLDLYVASTIKSLLVFYKRFSTSFKDMKNMYKDIHDCFVLFDNVCDVKSYSDFFSVKEFYLIKKNKNFYVYYIKKSIPNILSVKNSNNKKHKIITILGIKIKIKIK